MGGIILPFRGIAPRIAADVFVAPTASVIGDVEIGAGSSIWYSTVVRGDVNVVRIGRGSNIQDGAVIHVGQGGFGTFIGDDVLVGHLAMLHGCTLHDQAFVGMKATVLDGAVVESRAMVAAGAVITPGKVVRTGELWAGSPARMMRPLGEAEMARIVTACRNYAATAQEHRRSIGELPAAPVLVDV